MKHILCLPFLVIILSFQTPTEDNDEKLGIFLDQFRSATAAEIKMGQMDIPKDATPITINMINEAHRLVQDTFKHSRTGPLEPEQHRILYVYGGKQINTRTYLLQDSCKLMLFGLDCSGFMRQLFIAGGSNKFPIQNANTIRQVPFLKTQLPHYKIQDLKNIPTKYFRTGDLIYFKETADSKLSNHVGIIERNKNGSISMYHCSGWKNACEHNVSDLGGVRAVHLTPLLEKHWYGIVRISVHQYPNYR